MTKPVFSPPAVLLTTLLFFLGVFLVLPLFSLVRESLFINGAFSGVASFRNFLETPGLAAAFTHTITMGVTVTAITLVLAFALA